MYKNVWAGECGCFKAKIIRNPSLEKIEIGGDAYFHFETFISWIKSYKWRRNEIHKLYY